MISPMRIIACAIAVLALISGYAYSRNVSVQIGQPANLTNTLYSTTFSGSTGNFVGVGDREWFSHDSMASGSGNSISVTICLASGSTGPGIQDAWIGTASGLTPNYTGDQVQLTWNGSSNIPSGNPGCYQSDYVSYSYNNQNLLVGVDFANTGTYNAATASTSVVPARWYIAPVVTGGAAATTCAGCVSNSTAAYLIGAISIKSSVGGVPAITSALTATGTQNLAFNYNISATNSPTIFHAAPLPSGLGVNTGTGAITGTPTAIGTTNSTISASNAYGTGSANLAITINSPSSGAPSNLPQYLAIGGKAETAQRLTGAFSVAPWDYGYAYMNGDWQTWNTTPYGNGSVARLLIQADSKVTVLTYYYIGGGGLGANTQYPPGKYTALNTPSLVKQYFNDFTVLLQQAQASTTSGQAVVIDVEPDTMGQIERDYGDNAASVPMAIASSGYTFGGNQILLGLPNNGAGFAQAYIKVRDAVCPKPKCLLAFHPAYWGAGWGPVTANTAPAANGTRLVNFYNSTGANYDLMVMETMDADIQWYVANPQWGKNLSTATWTATDFSSYLTFMQTVFNGTGKYMFLWQTPVGNASYRTENNSIYHYQSQFVEYWLQPANYAHLQQLANVGILAILFGTGQETDTSQYDICCNAGHPGDGVTNPAAVNGNNLVSSYSDDDGGMLRLLTQGYYAGTKVPLR